MSDGAREGIPRPVGFPIVLREVGGVGRWRAVGRRDVGLGSGDGSLGSGLAIDRGGLGDERVGARLGGVVLLAPAREHLDLGRDDLRLPVALPVRVVPLARLEPTLERDLLALGEVLAANLGKAVPSDDVVVLGKGLSCAA